MFNRRQFLTRTLQGSSLLAMGTVVPQFVSRTAQAAAPGKDNILVVLEMTGGNDGLNTVIPYADDLYHKARPTLQPDQGRCHSPGRSCRPEFVDGGLPADVGEGPVGGGAGGRLPQPRALALRSDGHLAVGGPQAGRHDGLAGAGGGRDEEPLGGVPILQVGSKRSAAGLDGCSGRRRGHVSTIRIRFGFSLAEARPLQQKARRRLLEELAAPAASKGEDDLASFIQRRQVQTLTAVETLRELLEGPNAVQRPGAGLSQKLQLIAGLIARGFGTRIFYVSLDGFDTHAGQATTHANLLADLANSINGFFRDPQEDAATTAACG